MALTKGNSSPDKHMVSGGASGPSGATGESYSVGPADVKGGSTDNDAAAIYGAPGDATRMSRMKNVAQVACENTPNGVAGDDNASEAFIDGSTAKGFKSIMDAGDNMGGFGPNKPTVANESKIAGAPGFPGIP